jgi:hypothetical protein
MSRKGSYSQKPSILSSTIIMPGFCETRMDLGSSLVKLIGHVRHVRWRAYRERDILDIREPVSQLIGRVTISLYHLRIMFIRAVTGLAIILRGRRWAVGLLLRLGGRMLITTPIDQLGQHRYLRSRWLSCDLLLMDLGREASLPLFTRLLKCS